MFAVIGYSVGRAPAQAPAEPRDADAELAALALAGFPTRPSVARRAGDVAMATSIKPGDVGTTRPLGVYDPLGLMTKNPEKYRRFQ
jgi:hypothetical protein